MDARNFLFVSYDGLITDIAWYVRREGHAVRYYIEHEAKRAIGDGFVDKTDDWRAEVDWADVVVFDDVLGMGAWADELRRQGKAVVGGTAYTDRLEDDRSFGQQELKKHGVTILPFEEFDGFDAAIRYVKKHPSAYVIKPSGEAQNVKRLLFVGQEDDGKDVVQVLETYRKLYADQIKVFQLQKRVKGVEVAVGAFFNGHEFIEPVNINFEHKKLFPGNIGPSTGEMGTLMYWSAPNRLFTRTLKKLERTLREERYVGYIDLNCIVNAQGIYPLEFTARFGYPSISIQQEGMITPIGEFLAALAEGKDVKLKTRSGFQVGVRLVVPPYPYQDMDAFRAMSKDAAVLFKRPTHEGIHIEDVYERGGEWLITGMSGVVLVVVGTGTTVRQAQQQVYNRIRNIMIPNMYYRTDIGDRWMEDSDRLHNWGYLREM
ncbi:MAG: phosphoribosylglycinamide synthetase C domain-containing protein [Rhodothermales bacterium]|nr:phosphoribosylglycinamide synthetase C domain-containing protein [Rhodothermales bacterium]